MFVPKGKKIHLLRGGRSFLAQRPSWDSVFNDYQEMPLFLGEDLNIKTSSQYASPFQSMQEKAFELGMVAQTGSAVVGAIADRFNWEGLSNISGRVRNISFQNQNSAFQVWKYSEPMSFGLTVKFFLGIGGLYNARLEVYFPTLKLMSIVLPTARSESVGVGSVRTNIDRLYPPGPDLTDFINSFGGNSGERSSEGAFSISIGRTVRLPEIIIKDAEASFSHEVDTLGYPIYSTVRLSIETLKVATTNMVYGMAGDGLQSQLDDILATTESATEEAKKTAIGAWIGSLLGGG